MHGLSVAFMTVKDGFPSRKRRITFDTYDDLDKILDKIFNMVSKNMSLIIPINHQTLKTLYKSK